MRWLPLFLLMPLVTSAAETLVGRFPYIPSTPLNPEGLLDVRAKLAALPPIRVERAPLQLPDELLVSVEERPWLQKLRQAYRHLAESETAKAIPLFEDFLSKYPQHAPTRLSYAGALFAAGRLDAAERNYLDLLRDHPQSFQALNNLAWLYISTNDSTMRRPDVALGLVQRALVSAPDSHNVWSTLSQVQFALGHYEEALRAAQMAIFHAQRTQAGAQVESACLLQADRCWAALQATSLME